MQFADQRPYLKNLKKLITKCFGLVAIALLVGCSSNIVPPILLSSGQMEYPEEQRKSNTEGYVVVSYDVSVAGEVSNVKVVESSPPEVFNQAALDYIKTWKFQPKKEAGQAVEAKSLQSRISFLLEMGEASYIDFLK